MNNVFIQLIVLKIIVNREWSAYLRNFTESFTYIYIFFRQTLKLIIPKHPWPDSLEVHNKHKEHKIKTFNSFSFFLIQSSGGLVLSSSITSTTLHDQYWTNYICLHKPFDRE